MNHRLEKYVFEAVIAGVYDEVDGKSGVYDGDTLYARCFVPFHLETVQCFRLNLCNLPEIRGEERELGKKAKKHLQMLLPVGQRVTIRSHRTGSFGRWLADVEMKDMDSKEFDLVTMLIETGWALPWDGRGKRPAFDPNAPYPLPEDMRQAPLGPL